jgi:hypothetical protein
VILQSEPLRRLGIHVRLLIERSAESRETSVDMTWLDHARFCAPEDRTQLLQPHPRAISCSPRYTRTTPGPLPTLHNAVVISTCHQCTLIAYIDTYVYSARGAKEAWLRPRLHRCDGVPAKAKLGVSSPPVRRPDGSHVVLFALTWHRYKPATLVGPWMPLSRASLALRYSSQCLYQSPCHAVAFPLTRVNKDRGPEPG